MHGSALHAMKRQSGVGLQMACRQADLERDDLALGDRSAQVALQPLLRGSQLRRARLKAAHLPGSPACTRLSHASSQAGSNRVPYACF